MNPERRLREHLTATAARLSEPSDSLAEVVRRGRRRRAVQTSAAALAAVAAVFVVAGLWRSFDRTTIEFDPAAPPTDPTPAATATPHTAPTPGQEDGGESLSASDGNARGKVPYLVRDALMARPEVLRVDFEGGLQWFDPVRAAGR